MREEYCRAIGWAFFGATLIVALVWCVNGSGFAGWFFNLSERLLDVRLVQIGWLLTFLLLGLPGYIVKRYFDELAWSKHVEAMPKPDVRESLKKSKYVKADLPAATAPKPVSVADLPVNQEEFIATCQSCGHLFPAKRIAGTILKCSNCGEPVSI